MTAHEKELLALAVESCEERYMPLGVTGPATAEGGMWRVNAGLGTLKYAETTLAESLTALLRDLGVEVPERPSAEGLAHMAAAADANGWRYLREFAARDPRGPMYVLALLEGGAA